MLPAAFLAEQSVKHGNRQKTERTREEGREVEGGRESLGLMVEKEGGWTLQREKCVFLVSSCNYLMIGLEFCQPQALEGKWPHYAEGKPVLKMDLHFLQHIVLSIVDCSR
ncbi:hypothetical protein L1987_41414 [Smallanthus sonchifolius]|uniref:Uncharacterized protein n=1 Tax=Smallanthus sonchifolius TaxID=185202 RepID=A0ACB9GVQ0_9ASTR|nr:hypothetical protein L1987_41414 [Smallanthus sonchifolius]